MECVTHDEVVDESTSSQLTAQLFIFIYIVAILMPKAVFFNLFKVAEPKMTLKNFAEPKPPSN